MAGNAILILDFANTVNTSFFQLLYKHCVAFNSSNITYSSKCPVLLLHELYKSLGVFHPTPPGHYATASDIILALQNFMLERKSLFKKKFIKIYKV